MCSTIYRLHKKIKNKITECAGQSNDWEKIENRNLKKMDEIQNFNVKIKKNAQLAQYEENINKQIIITLNI